MTFMLTLAEEEESYQLQKSMHAMMMFGAGQLCGALLLGQISDQFGLKLGVVINFVLQLFNISVSLSFLAIFEYNFLAFAMAFFWGF